MRPIRNEKAAKRLGTHHLDRYVNLFVYFVDNNRIPYYSIPIKRSIRANSPSGRSVAGVRRYVGR